MVLLFTADSELLSTADFFIYYLPMAHLFLRQNCYLLLIAQIQSAVDNTSSTADKVGVTIPFPANG